ncbi:hypothetical protein A3K73_05870 [Candidatus Pacearchaeota archaeon RBG_13_36_9]|nr:MAG: hypothetical protein A3K73_05870 [Candidatus Pacearchaeota archaeon RBG_13_36_9]
MIFKKYKKILGVVNRILEPSIDLIQKSRKTKAIPYDEIERIIKTFFPRTSSIPSYGGFIKRVYIIHSDRKLLALKLGERADIKRDYNVYLSLPRKVRNRYFAEIYWRSKKGRFILQECGKKADIPERGLKRLQEIGDRYELKDIRAANVMAFDDSFKIVDADSKKFTFWKFLRRYYFWR